MITAPLHDREEERLDALYAKGFKAPVKPDPRFAELTAEAAKVLDVPISTVTLVDKDKERYLSCVGLEQVDGPRDISFCGHALLEENVLICEDTLEDDRFRDNPYVIGEPFIRFYAGMKLLDKISGLPIGVFCVKDVRPRHFSMEELDTFMRLATKAEKMLN